MGYTYIAKYKHRCVMPNGSIDDAATAPGSLWECDDCGKEYIKVLPSMWKATVTVISND
jgi:hypothetical protein